MSKNNAIFLYTIGIVNIDDFRQTFVLNKIIIYDKYILFIMYLRPPRAMSGRSGPQKASSY